MKKKRKRTNNGLWNDNNGLGNLDLTPTDAEIITIGKTAHVCAAEYSNS